MTEIVLTAAEDALLAVPSTSAKKFLASPLWLKKP